MDLGTSSPPCASSSESGSTTSGGPSEGAWQRGSPPASPSNAPPWWRRGISHRCWRARIRRSCSTCARMTSGRTATSRARSTSRTGASHGTISPLRRIGRSSSIATRGTDPHRGCPCSSGGDTRRPSCSTGDGRYGPRAACPWNRDEDLRRGRAELLEPAADVLDMPFRVEFRAMHVSNPTVRVDEIRDASGQAEESERPVRSRDSLVRVRDEPEVQPTVLREPAVRVLPLHGYAQDLGAEPDDRIQVVAERARFGRAAHRLVLRIEVQDHPPAPQGGEARLPRMRVHGGEVGRARADVEHWGRPANMTGSGAPTRRNASARSKHEGHRPQG